MPIDEHRPHAPARGTRVILVLGGTAEARELAAALDAAGDRRVVSSLAGRVARPRLPAGEVRIGGFGGPDELARWLREHGVAAVVDATHPFAERISASRRARLPGGRRAAPAPRAAGLEPSARATAGTGSTTSTRRGRARPAARRARLLTTGRQGLAAFARACDDAWFLIRCVDPPRAAAAAAPRAAARPRPLHARRRARADRPRTRSTSSSPRTAAATHTEAKLDAARERGLPVIVVGRPPRRRRSPTRRPRSPTALAWARRVMPGSAAACRRAAGRRRAGDDARRRGADDQQRAHVDDVEVERAERRDGDRLLRRCRPRGRRRPASPARGGRAAPRRARASCSRRVRDAGL